MSTVQAWPYRLGGWGTIIADPPWHFEGKLRRRLDGEVYKSTLSDAEILALDVGGLAAPACHLYLWSTEAHLELAIECLRAWGFVRKHSFVWCKVAASLAPRIGGGSYGRQAHELCLFAVRGKAPALTHDVPSWFVAERGDEHSAKPSQIHRIAERMSPGPRLELFARRRTPGWKAWGNQVAA